MPTNRRRTHSAGGRMDPRLVGLFSCGTSSNLMDADQQLKLWCQYGEHFLQHQWPHSCPCWAERAFGRPWANVLPAGFGHD